MVIVSETILDNSCWNVAGEYYISVCFAVVVLTAYDPVANVSRMVSLLSHGDSLGELNIMDGTRREATVIAKQRVEFLCLHKKVRPYHLPMSILHI